MNPNLPFLRHDQITLQELGDNKKDILPNEEYDMYLFICSYYIYGLHRYKERVRTRNFPTGTKF